MSARSSKNRVRRRARVALLAGGVMAALSFGALNAGSAAAAPACTGNNITGNGASLQKVAQQNVWAPKFASTICNKGTLPTVTYTSTSSGTGMSQWGFSTGTGPINTSVAFVGTDEAPSVAQIANIKSAAGGGAKLAVIPVTQTAISIVANPPAGCSIEEISNGNLTAVFEGRFLKWSDIQTAEGEGCNSPITRVVRETTSGTTYQFKNYLYQTNKKTLACTGAEKQTWLQLGQAIPNTVWPLSCEEKTLSPLINTGTNGGSAVVNKVDATEGSIGYAALPDAVLNRDPGTEILSLQNNGLGSAFEGTYVSPIAGNTANCETMTYKTPANVNTGLDLDWSGVFGAKPAIGGSGYPLCALTYVLAFNGYGAAGFEAKTATTVRDYVYEYLVQSTGQTDIASNYYSPLPKTEDVRTNILGAAQKAAIRIAF